ncbi:hypothetical protein GCM10022220_24570 [Actinocatenispora rupis]|uniref:Uncharacterized protein n=1 Tax=Actinocatenispora rupis TaxID=519421 RepID=A0A8J3JG33_9ACTN|nr:hypothetical protein Aru02nite_61720 [Actinocatenispora rupis]
MGGIDSRVDNGNRDSRAVADFLRLRNVQETQVPLRFPHGLRLCRTGRGDSREDTDGEYCRRPAYPSGVCCHACSVPRYSMTGGGPSGTDHTSSSSINQV